MVSGYHIFVHLRRIHIQMQNLGMFRKGGDIAHHPIAESGAGHDQQITSAVTHTLDTFVPCIPIIPVKLG